MEPEPADVIFVIKVKYPVGPTELASMLEKLRTAFYDTSATLITTKRVITRKRETL